MTSAARPQPKRGNPHQRRREQVYAVLSEAPAGATYSQLVEFVKEQTGKGCSRKLISQWKRESGRGDKSTDGRGQVYGQAEKSMDMSGQVRMDERGQVRGQAEKSMDERGQVHGRGDKSTDGRGQVYGQVEKSMDTSGQIHGQVDGRDPISANTVDGRDPINPKSPNVVPFKRPPFPKRRQTVTSGRGSAPVPAPVPAPIPNPKSKIPNRKRKSPNLIALAAISIGLALGCGWLLFSDDLPRLDKLELSALAKSVNSEQSPVGAQGLRPQSIQNQNNLKSQISNPKSISPKSLKITLNVTKPEHIKVKPGDEVAKGQIIADRPEERAAILAKKTQLEIAIKQATLGLAATPPPAPNFQAQEEALRQSKANIESQTLSPGFQFTDRQLQEIFESEKIAQENQTKQRKLEKSADIEASLAKLQEAKAEYQQQVKGQAGNQMEVEVTVVPRGE